MKILFPADGSKHTQRVIAYLVRNIANFGERPEIHLLNVHQPLPGRASSALSRATIARYYREETRKALAAAKHSLKRHRIAFHEEALIGEPGTAIADYATRGKFSLIVIGSRGQGALKGLVLGSVTTKVLACCKVPVLVIR